MEIRPVDPDFVRVWSRVKPPSPSLPQQPPAPEPEVDQRELLLGALGALRERRAVYQSLGLTGCARECQLRIRKLSAIQFFLIEENTPPISRSASHSFPNRSSALRQLIRAERACEQDFRQAQQRCPDPLLALVLEDCAQSCRRTQKLIWNSVENSF